MNPEVEKKYTALLLFFLDRWGFITNFRQMAKVGLPSATVHIFQQSATLAHALGHDPEYKDIVKDQKDFIRSLEDKLGTAMAQKSVDDFKTVIDATSLVFAHSVLDSVAYDCCEISATIAPDDWIVEVQKMTVELGEVIEYGKETLVKNRLLKLLARVERMPLAKKIEYIFKRCPPQKNKTVLDSYTYNSERLVRLDSLRHDIIHSNKTITRLPNGDGDLFFMRQTCLFLMVLLRRKYNIKIDLGLLPEILSET